MTKSLEKHSMLLPGVYDGIWSAYSVVIIFPNGNKSGHIKLNNGIRGVNCSCIVTVDEEGWVYIKD